MFDASTVRRAAGLQARLLNEIIDELFKEHHFSERKLAELLGHTRIEVLMGAIIGILAAMLVVSFPYLTAR
jgi:acid phosphatase family membrane protein YuiD